MQIQVQVKLPRPAFPTKCPTEKLWSHQYLGDAKGGCFQGGTWGLITEHLQSRGGSRMSIIDVSVHLDTHRFLEAGSIDPHVCALMPTQPCVHAHKHAVTHTATHLCPQMESHSSLDHLQWGAEALFPFRCCFIHSFICSINFALTAPSCQLWCWAPWWQKWTGVRHKGRGLQPWTGG